MSTRRALGPRGRLNAAFGRRLRHAARDDEGNAILEFCFLAVLFMVPLVYVLLSVFAVQSASYAVTAATREAGRAYTTSPSAAAAPARALAAGRIAMADHGLDLSASELTVSCPEQPCLAAGGAVRTTITVDVPLPFVPTLLGRAPATIEVRATHLALVDRFRVTG